MRWMFIIAVRLARFDCYDLDLGLEKSEQVSK